MENLINFLKSKLTKDTCLLEIKDKIKDFECFNESIKKKTDKSFERQLIFRNDIFEVFIIFWEKDYSTNYHFHPNNGCILKVIKGQLLEYFSPAKSLRSSIGTEYISEGNAKANRERLEFISETNKTKIEKQYLRDVGDVSYIDNHMGIHKVMAPEDSISIHIYSPPNFF